MDTRETPAAKAAEAAASQREPKRYVCFSNTENFPYPRRNGFSTDQSVLPIITPKQRGQMQSIWLLPKRFSMPQISLQIKIRVKINIAMRLNANLRMKVTQSIHPATRYGNGKLQHNTEEKNADYQYIIQLNQNNTLQ